MLKPLSDRVLVRPIPEDEQTASGIVLPDTAKEKPQKGEVIEVGPGKYEDGVLVPMTVKKGDRVLYKKYGPDEIKLGSEELLIIEESDILAIIPKGGKK